MGLVDDGELDEAHGPSPGDGDPAEPVSGLVAARRLPAGGQGPNRGQSQSEQASTQRPHEPLEYELRPPVMTSYPNTVRCGYGLGARRAGSAGRFKSGTGITTWCLAMLVVRSE